MNPQPAEILDTILGYLGFVASIELEEHEGTPVLQILTHEPQRLIGRREEVMEDLQHLVNRLLLAQNPPAPRIIVDVQQRTSSTRHRSRASPGMQASHHSPKP